MIKAQKGGDLQQSMGSNDSKVPKSKAARRNEELGDFSTTWRMLPISLLAIGIGAWRRRWFRPREIISVTGACWCRILLPVLGPDGTLSGIFTSGDLGQKDGIDAGKAYGNWRGETW